MDDDCTKINDRADKWESYFRGPAPTYTPDPKKPKFGYDRGPAILKGIATMNPGWEKSARVVALKFQAVWSLAWYHATPHAIDADENIISSTLTPQFFNALSCVCEELGLTISRHVADADP